MKSKFLLVWMVLKYFKISNRFVWITSLFSIFSMSIAVAILISTLSVVNGFEKVIHSSVIDFTGHLLVLKRGNLQDSDKEKEWIQSHVMGLESMSPFIQLEGMVAAEGKVLGVFIRGQDTDSHLTHALRHRVREGELNLEGNGVLIGVDLAKRLGVDVGDTIHLVIPKANRASSFQFQPKAEEFFVKGLLDLGKYDYNERVVVLSRKNAATMNSMAENEVSGYSLMLSDKFLAVDSARKIETDLGVQYLVRDWYSYNRNFLSAVAYEKWVLFFVLSIMIVAACFNISATLFISVLKRTQDISILKTLGASQGFLKKLFSTQGFVVGAVGVALGIVLALLLNHFIPLLPWLQIPAEIYKVSTLPVDLQITDVLLVVITSLVMTYLATLIPAARAAKLMAMEGLRYE